MTTIVEILLVVDQPYGVILLISKWNGIIVPQFMKPQILNNQLNIVLKLSPELIKTSITEVLNTRLKMGNYVKDGHLKNLMSIFKLLKLIHMRDWIQISVEIQEIQDQFGATQQILIRDGNTVMNLMKQTLKDYGDTKVQNT